MTDKLFQAIETANIILDAANDIEASIEALSNHKGAVSVLTQELRRLVVLGERNWQEIEQTDEFKTNFENRTQAQSAFVDLQDARK